MSNLVLEWQKAVRAYTILTEGLEELNKELRTAYSLKRIGEYRRGDRRIPPAVTAYMQRVVILHMLRSNGTLSKVSGLDLEALGMAVVQAIRLPELR